MQDTTEPDPVTDPPPDPTTDPTPDPSPDPTPGPTAGVAFDLRRSSRDRLLAGLCGGLAERFGVPAALVRVGFVLAAMVGLGVPLYVVGWVLVPDDTGRRILGRGAGSDLLAVGAVGVAGLVLLAQFDDWTVVRLAVRAAPWLVILGALDRKSVV